MLPGEHQVEHAAQGVDVVARARRLPPDHFGGRIRRRQGPQFAGVVVVRQRALAGRPRNPEVEDLDRAAGGHEDVARLEIRVDQAPLMGVFQPGAEVAEVAQGHFLAEGSFEAQKGVEGVALEQLHGHEDGVAFAIEVVNGDDIRMGQLLRLHRFLLQGDKGLGVLAETLAQDLDRHIGVAVLGLDLAQVAGPIDQPHAPLTEDILQHEAFLEQPALVTAGLLRQLPRLVETGRLGGGSILGVV